MFVGEVFNWCKPFYSSLNDVAGFNNNIKFNNEWFLDSEFKLLDYGLNSPYIININNILKLL